ncbi:MAG: hypothetical protein V4812_15655 [Pseudomonadota bacterium]
MLTVLGQEYPDQTHPDDQQEEQLDPDMNERDVDDDQLDKALEETFPASDPISP